MGNLRLTDYYVDLAKVKKHIDYGVRRYRSSADLRKRFVTKARKMRLRIVYKRKGRGDRLAKMSTTYYRQIRLAQDYHKYPAWAKASTFGHELVHARQWRSLGRLNFARKYVFNVRYRWALEMQGYAQSVMIMRALKVSKSYIYRFIETMPRTFRDAYAMRGIDKADLERWTKEILYAAYKA